MNKISKTSDLSGLWAISGTIIFVLGVIGVIFSDFYPASIYEQRSTTRSGPSNGACPNATPKIDMDLRDFSKGNSIKMGVSIELIDFDFETRNCDYELAIGGPGIEGDRRAIISLNTSNPSQEHIWVISASSVGRKHLLISTKNLQNSSFTTESIEYEVKYFGVLTDVQYTIISWITSFLGPMLTLPWWLKRRAEKKNSNRSGENNSN